MSDKSERVARILAGQDTEVRRLKLTEAASPTVAARLQRDEWDLVIAVLRDAARNAEIPDFAELARDIWAQVRPAGPGKGGGR